MEKNQWIYMGRSVAPHGLEGCFLVELVNEHTTIWKKNLPVKLMTDSGQEFLTDLIDVKGKVQKKIILKTSSHPTLESIKSILPIQIWANRSSFPPLASNEIYLQDLVGMEVTDLDGKVRARVKGITENHVQSLLILDDNEETMIPYVPAWIHSVDTELGKIVINPFMDF
ncbi:MAG: ribosome maturation factor RimM [Bacteriovoracaceae bacterium]|nr:ribosome maturation factor RimM [Bacteriovoracaceae bacterium]